MAQVTVKTDIPQTVNYQSCTVQVGTTTTLASDQNASVTNAGTEYNAVLNFGIPRGKSAYEQAVEGGYQGTEEEFNQILASSLNTVADSVEDVNTVADNIEDVNTAADNIQAIIAAPQYAQDAANSASDAEASETNAATSETNAALSAGAALASQTAAETAATSAGNSATTATTQANAAGQSAASASSSATSAQTSATNAQKWAEGADSEVTPLGGTHSSKGWANIARQYAESIGAALKYKGSVATYSALPSTGQEIGDFWNVLDTGKNYAWTGTEWDDVSGIVDLSAYRTAAQQDVIDATKQDTLVSGTNIKTVNGNSLLGSGNVDIDALPAQSGQSGKFLTTDGTDASWANVDALPSQTGNQGKYLTTNGTTASWDIPMAGLPMFYATYQPRKLNNASWLRADPYSWHSADLYVSAYAHLADNISGITAQTETIAGTTITYYRLSDEIKVVLPDQETNLDTIYNATGIGYYFVLDTTNRQFKLPRNIYGFTGYRGDVGGYVAPGLPNITGKFTKTGRFVYGDKDNGTYYNSGALYGDDLQSGGQGCTQYGNGTGLRSLAFNAALSNSIYGASSTVQPPATQAYLYFYVGNTVQNETSVDVGEITEALNNKADIDLGNLSNTGKIVSAKMSMPSDTYVNLSPVSGVTYTVPADGWVYALGKTSVVNGYVYISASGGMYDISYAGSTNYNVAVTMPVRSGQSFNCEAGGATLTSVQFFYAEGSKNLA